MTSESNTVNERAAIAGPSREKHWKELTDAEKIERLHQVVKQQMHALENISSVARNANHVAKSHCHADSGRVAIPVDLRMENSCDEGPRRRDSEWF